MAFNKNLAIGRSPFLRFLFSLDFKGGLSRTYFFATTKKNTEAYQNGL